MSTAAIPPDTDAPADLRIVDAAPSLYASTGQHAGVFAHLQAFMGWKQRYGHFDSIRRSHAWLPLTATIGYEQLRPTDRCRPMVMYADLRCEHQYDETCACVGDLVYRAACLHCAWEGTVKARENTAVEDAHDHSWPGWRDLPVVPSRPPAGSSAKEREALSNWQAGVTAVYPSGWLESGGPIRTGHTGRHIPNRTGFGGYDLATTQQ